ncbi:MAG: FAD-dependent oxidoreductase [Ignavibacteria bacterium]|nr:FAD-dependent oxidoreductase [Ignavibacteria bacterium]
MQNSLEIVLPPRDGYNNDIVKQTILEECGMFDCENVEVVIEKRSIDARPRDAIVRIRATVYVDELLDTPPNLTEQLQQADPKKRVVIVGSGPAGYFAALELLLHGITPVVVERGKDARLRRRDLRAIQQFGEVNPDSNYCYGEGGAGTYSDGKLYTRSHKRGKIDSVLRLLVEHGANPDILIDAHPHIGSNKLWVVVQNIRRTIERLGGSVLFDSRVVDFLVSSKENQQRIHGVILENGNTVEGDAVILATGHSARDVFDICLKHNVALEPKAFAMGVRIEHPQALIDELQYRQNPRSPFLPAAAYAVVSQQKDRGVFSFCMCPGGLIVPSATSPGEIVVNGMSMSRRDSPFANSGVVVAVDERDWTQHETRGALAGVAYQLQIEHAAFNAVRTTLQVAPAQRVTDFMVNKVSSSLPPTSYIPGVASADLRTVLPTGIISRLKGALLDFEKQMKGYVTEDAVVVGVESRTSCPVRIPRSRETFESTNLAGLFPSGEGAGYAGGIVSAALDGQNVARAIAAKTFSAEVLPDNAAPFM